MGVTWASSSYARTEGLARQHAVGNGWGYAGRMLEDAIERLTAEVVRLREAVERQTAALAHGADVTKMVAAAREGADAHSRGANAYLNDREVAQLTGLSLATLRRWRLFRKGPPFRKFGRAVRYARADVIAWMDGQKAE